MLRAIYVFMVFSFGLVAVGFVRETMDQMQRNQQSETIADLERSKSDLEKSLSSPQRTQARQPYGPAAFSQAVGSSFSRACDFEKHGGRIWHAGSRSRYRRSRYVARSLSPPRW